MHLRKSAFVSMCTSRESYHDFPKRFFFYTFIFTFIFLSFNYLHVRRDITSYKRASCSYGSVTIGRLCRMLAVPSLRRYEISHSAFGRARIPCVQLPITTKRIRASNETDGRTNRSSSLRQNPRFRQTARLYFLSLAGDRSRSSDPYTGDP